MDPGAEVDLAHAGGSRETGNVFRSEAAAGHDGEAPVDRQRHQSLESRLAFNGGGGAA